MTAVPAPPFGREDEVAALVDATVAGRSAIVIAPAGMGKSTVIQSFRDAAQGRDRTVLVARPTEPEHRLAFSGLTDLLSDLPPEEYDELPPPQRAALRAALMLDHDSAYGTGPLPVAAGVRNLLRRMSVPQPLLLIIDDAQWLDDATRTVLGTALRRLGDARVTVVAAARPSGPQPMEWLPEPPEPLFLAPLGRRHLFQMIRSRLGVVVGRGELLEIERASGGNPLFALEFARHKGVRGGFDQVVGDRLRLLPRATRLALMAAALATDAHVELVAAVRGCDTEELLEQLDPAVRAGLVTVTGCVGFSHPLFAHAVTETAAAVDVRETHQRLAALETSVEAQAWHLAFAMTDTDTQLANRLAAAADIARRRGGWDSSIALLKLALERTPEAGPQAARALSVAVWLAEACRFDEAESLLRRVRETGTRDESWTATLELADLLENQGRLREVSALVEEMRAADLHALPPLLRARFLVDFDAVWLPDDSGSVALERTRSIQRELAGLPDCPEAQTLRVRALTNEAVITEGLAAGNADEQYERLRSESEAFEHPSNEAIVWRLGFRMFQQGRHDDARAYLKDRLRQADLSGDEGVRAILLSLLATVDRAAGRWRDAEEYARQAWEASLGQGDAVQSNLEVSAAWLLGLRGDLEGAERRLRPMIEHDEREPNLVAMAHHRAILADVLLAHGHTESAYELFTAARAAADEAECLDPTELPIDAGLIRAMIDTARLDAADAHLALVRERSLVIGRPVEHLTILHFLLRAARGDAEGAAGEMPAALARHDEASTSSLDIATAHLLAGRVYRRARQKRLAAESLTKAIEIFESLPCPPYAVQARAELARVGLRPRAPVTLTETERHVAELAGRGLRNKEIAEQAFISPKTVEAVLSRVYRKLGIRSRAGLGRALETLNPDG